MPRIPDDFLKAVVFIYPSHNAALEGLPEGGSGFLVSHGTPESDLRTCYVVTNAHVVESGGQWVRIDDGRIVHIPNEDWHTGIPDDFAVARLTISDCTNTVQIPIEKMALTPEEAQELNVGPGDDTFMIGRFSGHAGRSANNPVARFGNISLMPNRDDLVLDGRGRRVEAYLVEMHTLSGFSGSAVFLLIESGSFRGGSHADSNTRIGLLGIDTGQKLIPIPVKEQGPAGNWTTRKDMKIDAMTDLDRDPDLEGHGATPARRRGPGAGQTRRAATPRRSDVCRQPHHRLTNPRPPPPYPKLPTAARPWRLPASAVHQNRTATLAVIRHATLVTASEPLKQHPMTAKNVHHATQTSALFKAKRAS